MLRHQIISQIISKSSASHQQATLLTPSLAPLVTLSLNGALSLNAQQQRHFRFRSTATALSLNGNGAFAQRQRRSRSTATALSLNGAFARNAFARSGQF
jgi:hypothetical protein